MKSWTGQPSQVLRRGLCLHDGVERGQMCQEFEGGKEGGSQPEGQQVINTAKPTQLAS